MHFLIHRQDNYFQCGSEIGSCFLQVITIQLRFPYPLEINVQLIECRMFKGANIIMDIYILPCQKIIRIFKFSILHQKIVYIYLC